MNTGWRVIDCSALEGSIRYRRGRLVIQKGPDEFDVPLAQVAVLLIGTKTGISGAVLAKLSELDIAVLVCDWRSIPVAGALPWREHTRVGARQRAQAELALPKKKAAWKAIIKAKIYGQARAADAIVPDTTHQLAEIVKSVRSGDTDNCEAQAARIYWSLLRREGFASRNPGSRSGINGGLDYGYTLLRGYGIRAVTSAGLAGSLGVFHRGRGNAFALVDDLIEPFRPMVDYIVFREWGTSEELTKELKTQIAAGFERPFSRSGKTIPTVFVEFAQLYGKYVELDVPTLNVPKWDGELNASER